MTFKKCRFQGNFWYVVYEENGKVHLRSFDGAQFKTYIHKSEIQIIDEFADAYPEE